MQNQGHTSDIECLLCSFQGCNTNKKIKTSKRNATIDNQGNYYKNIISYDSSGADIQQVLTRKSNNTYPSLYFFRNHLIQDHFRQGIIEQLKNNPCCRICLFSSKNPINASPNKIVKHFDCQELMAVEMYKFQVSKLRTGPDELQDLIKFQSERLNPTKQEEIIFLQEIKSADQTENKTNYNSCVSKTIEEENMDDSGIEIIDIEAEIELNKTAAEALEDDISNQANKQHGQAKVLSKNMDKMTVKEVKYSGHSSNSECNNVSSNEVADSEMAVLIDYNILDRMQQQLNESYKNQCDLVDKWQQSDSKVKELNALINQKEKFFRGREDYLQGKICELKDKINKLLNKESDLIEQKGALKLKVKTLKKSQNKYRSMYRNEIEVRSKLEKELASAGEKSLKKHEKIMNILNNTDQDQIMTLARKRYFKN